MYSIKMVMGFNMLTLHIIRFGKNKCSQKIMNLTEISVYF